MKAYALVVLSLLVSVIISCDGPTDSSCQNFPEWDKIITNEEAKEMQARWEKKWDYPESSPYHKAAKAIPDSFFINFLALEIPTIGRCGFRIYYGLTEPGKLSSMGLIITGINDHFGDILDGDLPMIYFTNATKPRQIEEDSLTFFNKPIDLKTAQAYTSNWRCFNGVTRDNDVLENFPCDGNQQIPPAGLLPTNITQKIPLGNAFGPSEDVFLKLLGGEEYHNFEAFIIYNGFSLEDGNNSVYSQDFYLRGYLQKEKGDPYQAGFVPLDITGPCPPLCNIEDALQADQISPLNQ